MDFNIEGKIALITGAARGIGLEYARELLKHGLKGVTIVDIDAKHGENVVKQLNSQYGQKVAVFERADVTKSNEIKHAFSSAVKTWKTLDIVINNAGILKDNQWEMEIAVNCNAVVTGSLLAMEYMGKNRGGKGGVVVNISSILGLQEFSGCPVYVGTKYFVLGMTRSFGQPFFYNLTGIKFVTMCPGVTHTPLAFEVSNSTLENQEGLSTFIAEEVAKLPNQKAEHVAKNMLTLITQGANGSVWVCEGGEPIYEIDIPDRMTLKKID